MRQEQVQKSETAPADDDEQDALPGPIETNVDEGTIDSILDEIDDVLEENAEQFVNGYVQKGGQ